MKRRVLVLAAVAVVAAAGPATAAVKVEIFSPETARVTTTPSHGAQLVGAATAATTPTAPAEEEDDGETAAPLILLAALFVAGIGGGIALFTVFNRRRSA